MCIHNRFGFDLDKIAIWSDPVDPTHVRDRRWGNSGITTYKYIRREWNTMSLAGIADKLDLRPKLDVEDMKIEHDES